MVGRPDAQLFRDPASASLVDLGARRAARVEIFDVPQVSYFKHYADFLQRGDRVILVTPEPSWIKAGRIREKRTTQAHRNMLHLEQLILKKQATIPIKIAGDLHHYARYVRRRPEDAPHHMRRRRRVSPRNVRASLESST